MAKFLKINMPEQTERHQFENNVLVHRIGNDQGRKYLTLSIHRSILFPRCTDLIDDIYV